MIEIIVIGILFLVIVALLVERYFYVKSVNVQLHDYMVAVMSKNTNEYIATKITEKAEPFINKVSDEVPLDVASDEEFDKFIKTQNES